MELVLRRKSSQNDCILGELYIDGVHIADTLEDVDRGLTDKMSLSDIKNRKVFGKTCIPYGTYEIDMETVSPKYSNFEKYGWARYTHGKLPRLKNVKGYEGVLIHPGNTAKDTEGCILVGVNKGSTDRIYDSVVTFTMLYSKLNSYHKFHPDEKINITVTK